MAHLAPGELDTVIEQALAELPREGWQVVGLRDVPRGLKADFAVVGPPGVFVIGCAPPEERDRVRAKRLMALVGAAHSVAEVAGVRPDEVHPVLCLTGDEPQDSWSRGVTMCGVVNLADALVFKRERLANEEVEAAAETLRDGLREPRGVHRRAI